jgi:hypothetical protein
MAAASTVRVGTVSPDVATSKQHLPCFSRQLGLVAAQPIQNPNHITATTRRAADACGVALIHRKRQRRSLVEPSPARPSRAPSPGALGAGTMSTLLPGPSRRSGLIGTIRLCCGPGRFARGGSTSRWSGASSCGIAVPPSFAAVAPCLSVGCCGVVGLRPSTARDGLRTMRVAPDRPEGACAQAAGAGVRH